MPLQPSEESHWTASDISTCIQAVSERWSHRGLHIVHRCCPRPPPTATFWSSLYADGADLSAGSGSGKKVCCWYYLSCHAFGWTVGEKKLTAVRRFSVKLTKPCWTKQCPIESPQAPIACLLFCWRLTLALSEISQPQKKYKLTECTSRTTGRGTKKSLKEPNSFFQEL